jgi:hypothetical protein
MGKEEEQDIVLEASGWGHLYVPEPTVSKVSY